MLSGKGWYDYEKGSRKPLHSPEVAALIDAHRTEIGRFGCKADLSSGYVVLLLTPTGSVASALLLSFPDSLPMRMLVFGYALFLVLPKGPRGEEV